MHLAADTTQSRPYTINMCVQTYLQGLWLELFWVSLIQYTFRQPSTPHCLIILLEFHLLSCCCSELGLLGCLVSGRFFCGEVFLKILNYSDTWKYEMPENKIRCSSARCFFGNLFSPEWTLEPEVFCIQTQALIQESM